MSRSLSTGSPQGKYRSFAVHCGLILFIGLPCIHPAVPRETYPNEARQDDQRVQPLGRDNPIERELAGGQSHSYQLQLDAGQYANLVVDQRGIDIVVRLLGPDGKQIAEFDSESRLHGQESVSLVAEEAGGYRLIAQPKQKGAPAGAYKIWIKDVRLATNDDRALQEAHRLYAESGRLERAFKFDEAFPLVERALEIRERVLGPDHLEVAAAVNSLAVLYWRKGDFANAERLYQRARTVYEKSLEPEHPYIASSLGGLALVYDNKGDFAKAEPLFQQALSIWEKALGPEHANVSRVLNSLARLYRDTGAYAKAERLYQRDVAAKEKALGPENPNVARALNNLADYYNNIGEAAKAEPLYWRALDIYEKSLGPEDLNLTTALDGLAAVYGRIKGSYARAETLYKRSLAIWEKALGPEQFHVAPPLESFASFYYNTGEYAKAEPLFRRALIIYENSLGPEHVHVANALNKLAALYAAKGDIAQAVSCMSRVNAIRERILTRNLAEGSERQKLAYLALFSKETDFTISLHSRIAPDDPQALDLAFTTLLRRKGRGLDAMANTIATLRRHASPQDQKLFDQLADARARLASLTLGGPGAANPDTYKKRLKPLEEKVEELEVELSSRGAEFRARTQPATLAAVQAAIPADGALIEFAVYAPQDPQTGESQPPRYIAYTLAAQGRVKWVDLGEAAAIDRAVGAWRKALRNPNRMDVKRLGRAVDEKVARPVRPLLGEARRLLIAPDGSLNLIPFAALVDERDRNLIERYAISYLTSGRDLLRLQTSQPSKSPPMVVANPDFGRAATAVARAGQNALGVWPGNPGRRQNDPDRIYFQQLPSTRREALAIKAALPETSVLLREQATESALKQARSPRILHIATHGFFLSDQEPPPAEARGFFDADSLRASGLRFSKWAAKVENPLLRSGLALAGANWGKSGDDDGLLTALEVAGLDLWGTKLVTLSACDTGVGEVKNGEGVQGLRRALVLAGSESQVMSLWPVVDDAARDLMVPYYKALRQGKGRSDGLRQSQLRMLRSKDRRHPFYWAAFIQSGEWANLDGKR